MGRPNRKFVSCYQCVGIKHCYGDTQPSLKKEKARAAAAQCISLHKGLPQETINLIGFKRGISRKNAENLFHEGSVCWVAKKTIMVIADLPEGIASRLKKAEEKAEKLKKQ